MKTISAPSPLGKNKKMKKKTGNLVNAILNDKGKSTEKDYIKSNKKLPG